ncbi:MAG: hypothetical protein ACLQG3_18065 [Terracidiphilus sp.]
MKNIALCLMLSLLAAPAVLLAQNQTFTYGASQFSMLGAGQTSGGSSHPVAMPVRNAPSQPFSRLALSGGVGAGGVNMQAAVEANRYLNIRGIGNYFKYTVNSFNVSGNNGSSGIDVNGNVNFATAGIALDYYPWPNHGFRLSPGVMLYNQNQISASGLAIQGTSITLGSQKYYSEGGSNAMTLNANLGLNTHQQAFTMTTGWGNMISRRGGHLSFPVEIGAIFTGVPTIGLTITGYGCTSSSDDVNSGAVGTCVNMATNTTAQSNLNAQIAKYKNDLDPLKVYPVFSFGVAYNFKIR